MEECEVCGRKSAELYLVDIEGAQMRACKRCSAGKQVLQTFGKEQQTRTQVHSRTEEESDEIIEDYGRVIRGARQALGLPARVLAERINEKESTIVRVESGHALPDDRLARKLEHALGIKLIIKEGRNRQHYSQSRPQGVTLGDAAIIRKDLSGDD
jgi:putative transcription factor